MDGCAGGIGCSDRAKGQGGGLVWECEIVDLGLKLSYAASTPSLGRTEVDVSSLVPGESCLLRLPLAAAGGGGGYLTLDVAYVPFALPGLTDLSRIRGALGRDWCGHRSRRHRTLSARPTAWPISSVLSRALFAPQESHWRNQRCSSERTARLREAVLQQLQPR